MHRSLGAHISRVRSLALDSIDNLALAALLQLGNVVSNAIFEDQRQLQRQGCHKPAPEASRAQRGAYIREKYENRSFVSVEVWRHCLPERYVSLASPRLSAALEVSDSNIQATALLIAAEEGNLPFILLCLAKSATGDSNASAALHAAASHCQWVALHLLVSFTGWYPPGDSDSSGRTVWQTALAALTASASAILADSHVQLSSSRFHSLKSISIALVTLLVRPMERPHAIATATHALEIALVPEGSSLCVP